jgi:hypothetical protein
VGQTFVSVRCLYVGVRKGEEIFHLSLKQETDDGRPKTDDLTHGRQSTVVRRSEMTNGKSLSLSILNKFYRTIWTI